jgi:Putative Actinobacterial Holin-X, holin superfamily III
VATRKQDGNELRERPIGEVTRDLTSDLSLLLRQEVELAKAELAEKGRTAAPGLGMFGGAGIVGLCAAGALTAFLVLVCSLFLPEWAAALIVGAVLAVTAYLLIRQGKERVADAGTPVPEQTIQTVKEDVEWARTRASSARK